MASLITDIETVKQFVRINYINDVRSLPDFELAAERYLIPIIGQELYDALTGSPESDEPLVKRCRAVIGPLGYLMELAIIQTQLTDSGLRTASSENLQAAHRWEYEKMEAHLADKGAFAIESLLKYLFDNQDANVLWTDSAEYKEANELVFRSALEFNKFFPVLNPHLVWWELRPLIREVEDFYIKTSIGEEFFNHLKTSTELTNEEKSALLGIKKVVAQIVIVKAVEKLSVKLTSKGFTILISSGNSDASNSGDQPQKDNQLSLLYQSCERSGEAYLLELLEYLNKTATADIFPLYYASDRYVSPSRPESANRNENRKSYLL